MIKLELKENRLSKEQIIELLNQHPLSDEVTKYQENERYYKGNNPKILNRAQKEDGVPDNRVPIPYGRKIALTTKNYMFSRPVQYISEDKKHMEKIEDIFTVNHNDNKVNQIGKDLIVHGYSYKLFYMDKDNISGQLYARYVIIPQDELILIYDYNIEPNIQAAIRYYSRDVMIDGKSKKGKKVEVYYMDRVFNYDFYNNELFNDEDTLQPFDIFPIVAYKTDDEMGVFDAVKSIIDGIDIIISSDLNEVQRFELAYLILTGQEIKKEDLKKAKEKRLFELDKEATLQYLLKQVDGEFNGSIRDFLVSEIHKQSGVPDFASKDFAAESGVALLYKLIGFENIAAEIQSTFIEGEEQSIDIINSILYRNESFKSIFSRLAFWKKNPQKKINIEMIRNLPENVKEKIEIAKGLQELGISDESVLEVISSILKVDIATEKERKATEREAYPDLMGNNEPPISGDKNNQTDENAA